MPRARPASGFWIGVLLSAGAVLAIALLVQTVVNYRYVSADLIAQEARRVANERLRNIERAARRPVDAAAFQTILDDLRADTGDEVASVALLLQGDGTTVAASGPRAAAVGPEERRRFMADRSAPFRAEQREAGEVLVGVLACRCTLLREPPGGAGQLPPGRLLVEIALYRSSLSAPFARLRRNAAISASAALVLLVSVSLIGLRFRPYVRGKLLEAQMDIARDVQRDLLPAADTWPAGVDVAAECVPAAQVGGDFYDVVALPGARVAFALGDVSGHGIPAALLMGLVHGAMSSPVWGGPDEAPDQAAARLNRLLLTKSSGERFASLFWCAYDPGTGVLRYINAGHMPPLWIRRQPDGSTIADRLPDGGPVLGVLNAPTYRTAQVQTHEGDLLVLFSDGIVEAVNRRDEYFGEERLVAVTREHQDQPARKICDAILSAVRALTDNAPADDDQTLLVVRLWRTGDGAVAAPAAPGGAPARGR